MMSLNYDLANVAALHAAHKVAENNFRFASVLSAKNTEQHKQNQRQDQPKSNMF
jgi:hypothetical protein